MVQKEGYNYKGIEGLSLRSECLTDQPPWAPKMKWHFVQQYYGKPPNWTPSDKVEAPLQPPHFEKSPVKNILSQNTLVSMRCI